MSSVHLRVCEGGWAHGRAVTISANGGGGPRFGGGRHHDYIIGILEGERADARVVGP